MFRGNTVRAVCCAAALTCGGADVGGMTTDMKMPTIAYSQNEGPALAEYHKHIADPEMGFEYFMPRSKEELETLYNIYKSGQIDRILSFSPLEVLWHSIIDEIRFELLFRCKDGDKNILDEYLSWFRDFIRMVDEFPDQTFVAPIKATTTGALSERLGLLLLELEYDFSKNNLSRSSAHLPYCVDFIDKLLKSSRNFHEIDLSGYYRRRFLTDEFINSAEYKAIRSSLEEKFLRGVPLF
jgi:hypothetical protein